MYFDQQQYEMVLMEHKERLAMAQQQQLLREGQSHSRRDRRSRHWLFAYLKQPPIFLFHTARSPLSTRGERLGGGAIIGPYNLPSPLMESGRA
jgi:hypothetical protein